MADAPSTQANRFDEDARSDGNGHHQRPQDAFQHLPPLIAELKEYASYYLSARIDSLKVTVRNLGIYAVLGIVAAIAAVTAVIGAVALTLVGIAWSLGVLFGGRYWLSTLLVGLLLIGLFAAGAYLGLKALTSRFRKQTVRKYEQRQQQELADYGRNVSRQAAAHAQHH